MNSSPTSPLICPTCKGENVFDSRFCRLCGHALDGARAFATEVAAEVAAEEKLAPGEIVDEPLSSPGEIDARRAAQLLERALHLGERGDTGGAILACRQSIALAPTSPGGHAMLGLLLERSGDLPHSLAAYEKAVQLAPEGQIEREGLERLRAKMDALKTETSFHFDDDELFPTSKAEAAPTDATAAAVAAAAVAAAAVGSEAKAVLAGAPPEVPGIASGLSALDSSAEAASVQEGDHSPNVVQTAASASPVAVPTAAPVVFERRLKARRRFNVPITIERRSGFDRRASASASQSAPLISRSAASVTSFAASPVAVPAPVFAAPAPLPSSGWNNLWRRPSYFGRSLPLAGATVLALGLLSLARSSAVARTVEAQMRASNLPVSSGDVPSSGETSVTPATAVPGQPLAPANGLPPLAAIGASQAQVPGAVPITNATAVPVAPRSASPSTAAGNSGSRAAAPRTNSGRSGTSTVASTAASTGRPPRFPNILPPAAVPPARSSSSSSGDGSLSLPAPNIGSPSPAEPPVNVLPPGSSSALDPSGSSGRGYVRITQGHIGTATLPQRASAQGNSEERAAADAARQGQPDRAIERLSAAINANAADAGYRYQQRATLFLERGDYSRAADDFQAAITAYNAQIERGDQVATARAGLKASRSGLNLALAGGR